MKKTVFVALMAMALTFSAAAEDKIGIDVGTDITAGGILSGVSLAASPNVSYSTSVADFDLSAVLGFDATLYTPFSADDIYFNVGASKSFKLAEKVSLVPALKIKNVLVLSDPLAYGLGLDAGAGLETGDFTTTVKGKFALPIAGSDFGLALYVEEATAIADVDLALYTTLAMVPDFAVSNVGLSVGYPVGPVYLGLNPELSGFGGALDLAITASVYYSF